jgi:hypothetical protein
MFLTVRFPKKEKKGIKLSEYLKKRVAVKMLPLVLPIACLPTTVLAAGVNQDAIIKAFDPLIDLAQAMSYPMTFLVILGGMLFVIIGQRAKGMQMIKYAVVGFLGVQFVPAIMRILMQVGTAMRAAQQ